MVEIAGNRKKVDGIRVGNGDRLKANHSEQYVRSAMDRTIAKNNCHKPENS